MRGVDLIEESLGTLQGHVQRDELVTGSLAKKLVVFDYLRISPPKTRKKRRQHLLAVPFNQPRDDFDDRGRRAIVGGRLKDERHIEQIPCRPAPPMMAPRLLPRPPSATGTKP